MALSSQSSKENKVYKVHINHKNVILNDKLHRENKKLYKNRIITSKYTLLNFLPKNLFYQFQRVANLYFLLTSVIQVMIESSISPATSLIPLTFVVLATALKQGYEDWLRHKSDRLINSRLVPIIDETKSLIKIKAQEIRPGDVVKINEKEEVPCDLILLYSNNKKTYCSISTVNLDGETNLKKKQCLAFTKNFKNIELLAELSGIIECDKPNPELYEFDGLISIKDNSKILQIPLNINNLILRGCKIINTNYIFGIAIYTGNNTKMSLNSKVRKLKFSSLERSINYYLFGYLFILIFFCTSCLFFHIKIKTYLKNNSKEHWYLQRIFTSEINQYDFWIENLLKFFVLYNYLIPISLYVNLEITKFFGAKLLLSEKDLFLSSENIGPICNCSDINEDLGQVQYLFSDKTGTLTENVMHFAKCTINGKKYVFKEDNLYLINGKDLAFNEDNKLILQTFFVCLVLCSTVTIEFLPMKSLKKKKIEIKNYKNKYFQYIADSPDEKALIEAAYKCNVKLIYSDETDCKLLVNDQFLKFVKLHVIEFDSNRRRMSVIVKDDLNDIWLICKGAESELFEKITGLFIEETYANIDNYANDGLRTLVLARKKLTQIEFSEYMEKISNIIHKSTLNKTIFKINSKLEQGLVLLGATALEDKLQDDVEETIEYLKKAGIKIWLLTGDKLETSVSVAISCKLIEPNFNLLFLSKQKNYDDCGKTLLKFWLNIKNSKQTKSENIFNSNVQGLYSKLNAATNLIIFLINKLDKDFLKQSEIIKRNYFNFINKKIEIQNEKTLNLIIYEFLIELDKKLDIFTEIVDFLKKILDKSLISKTKFKLKDYNKLIEEQNVNLSKHLEDLQKMNQMVFFNLLNKFELKNQLKNQNQPVLEKRKEYYITDEKKLSKLITLNKNEKYALIVDGQSLYLAFKYHIQLFLLCCQNCSVVLCSRMSPIQKAQVVRMIRNSPEHPITAAIGDGANDVSMISEANVGFGIIGKEGHQAVRSADFAFAKFKFLKPILLVHGYNFYYRISTLIHYSFCKSLIFIIPQYIHSFYTMHSAQSLYHGMLLMMFNFLFTSCPIFIFSIFEENISKDFLLNYPAFYKNFSKNKKMSAKVLLRWILISIIQGFSVYYLVYFISPSTISILSDGKILGLYTFGIIVFHIVILVVNLKVLIITQKWSKLLIYCILSSVLGLPLFCFIYSSFIWSLFGDEMFGHFNPIACSLSFWLILLSIVTITIIPDIIYSIFENFIYVKELFDVVNAKNQ